MIDYFDVYIFTDQPTTCPKCGSRTEITLDLYLTPKQTQHHICYSTICNFEFVVQKDNEK